MCVRNFDRNVGKTAVTRNMSCDPHHTPFGDMKIIPIHVKEYLSKKKFNWNNPSAG